MPFIAYDLDAIAKAQHAARASRVTEDVIHGGNLRMWEFCWRSATDHLTALQVRGFYATDNDVVPGLVAFGFLEPAGDSFRVKGAERYLRVTEARRKGGLAAKSNLIPGSRQKRVSREPSREPAETQPRASREPFSAASRLYSEQRTANSEVFKKTTAGGEAPNPPVTLSVKKPETERPFSAQDETLPDVFCRVWKAKRGSEYAWRSKDDNDSRAALQLAGNSLQEFERVLSQALDRTFPLCRNVADLSREWPTYAGRAPEAPKRGRATNAEKDWDAAGPVKTDANGDLAL